jgi:RNA polymerase sigma factor (sigma-70 family)
MIQDDSMVFVVDDDPGLRQSLARLIRSAGMEVKTFASPQELLDQGPPSGPGCLVLDVHLPGLNGLELQQELAARKICTPIIFITGQGDIPTSVKAMKGGAIDFLTKPFKATDLLTGIQEAFKKDRQFRTTQVETEAIQDRVHSLTPREREVLNLVVTGLMNKQIAAELGASEKTIKVHRSRVMRKMQVASVADLVRAAERVKAESTVPNANTTKVP